MTYICLTMNRILYISLLIIALGFVSCTKQDFSPNSDVNQDVPTWEKGITSSGEGVIEDGGSDDGTDNGGIVDPNNDPDGKSKKRN